MVTSSFQKMRMMNVLIMSNVQTHHFVMLQLPVLHQFEKHVSSLSRFQSNVKPPSGSEFSFSSSKIAFSEGTFEFNSPFKVNMITFPGFGVTATSGGKSQLSTAEIRRFSG